MANKENHEEKGLAVKLSDDALAALKESYPVEQGFNRIMLPRISMASQDVMEGKGKSKKVIVEAGTFFLERPTDEEDEDGKKQWEKLELGTEIEGIILFKRKQLRYYDESTEQYTSSPIYDADDEVVPLFCDKSEVGRGTPKELKAKYEFKDEDGKMKSKLEENRILYVLFEHEDEKAIYQMNLRGSSMYAFMSYTRDLQKKNLVPPAVVTHFSSEAREKGTIEWNQMTFEAVRTIENKDAKEVIEKVEEIKRGIAEEKEFYANRAAQGTTKDESAADKEFKKF